MKKFLEFYNDKCWKDFSTNWRAKVNLPEYFTESDLTLDKFTNSLKNHMLMNEDRFSSTNHLSDEESKHLSDQIGNLVEKYRSSLGGLDQSIMADHIESNPFSPDKIKTQPYGEDIRPMFQDGVVSLRDKKIEKQKLEKEEQAHNNKVMADYGINKNPQKQQGSNVDSIDVRRNQDRQQQNKDVMSRYGIKPKENVPSSPQEVNRNVVDALDRFRMKKSITHKDVFELSSVVMKSVAYLDRFPNKKSSEIIQKLCKSRVPVLDYSRYMSSGYIFTNSDKDVLVEYFKNSFNHEYKLKV